MTLPSCPTQIIIIVWFFWCAHLLVQVTSNDVLARKAGTGVGGVLYIYTEPGPDVGIANILWLNREQSYSLWSF